MNWLEISALNLRARLRRGPTHAAEYPTRPIRLVVPYGAGGPISCSAAWSAIIFAAI